MSPEETSLARLLVALPGWRWVLGMPVCVPDDRGHVTAVLDGGEGVTVYVCFDEETRSCRFDEETSLLLPCPAAPATAGILLGMLWAADPDAGWHVHGPPGLICVHRADGTDEHYGDSLGVAVARALVAIGRCA